MREEGAVAKSENYVIYMCPECGETRRLAIFTSCIQSTECDCGGQMKMIWPEEKKND